MEDSKKTLGLAIFVYKNGPHRHVNPVNPSFFLQLRHRFFFGFFAGTGSSFSSCVCLDVEGTCTTSSLDASLFDSVISTVLSDKVVGCWRSDLEVEVLASLVWVGGAFFFCTSL